VTQHLKLMNHNATVRSVFYKPSRWGNLPFHGVNVSWIGALNLVNRGCDGQTCVLVQPSVCSSAANPDHFDPDPDPLYCTQGTVPRTFCSKFGHVPEDLFYYSLNILACPFPLSCFYFTGLVCLTRLSWTLLSPLFPVINSVPSVLSRLSVPVLAVVS
jgi:hypothetical protein